MLEPGPESESNPLEGFEDPLDGSLVVSVVQGTDKQIQIESNAVSEYDLIAVLIKATVAACLDSLIQEHEDGPGSSS